MEILQHMYIEKLSHYDICFACPEGLDTVYYQKNYPLAQIKRFQPFFFEGLQGYNQLMLSPIFYNAFTDMSFAYFKAKSCLL